MSALTAQAAPNIPISAVPFNITGPGTYVFVRNLTYTGSGSAITISNITGPVILDLKGFTLAGPVINSAKSAETAISVNPNPTTGGIVINPNPVTIRNGTISWFRVGVYAQFIDGLTVSNMNFDLVQPGDSPSGGTGIQLTFVNNALIRDCNIVDALYGIYDYESSGGNRYENVNCGAVFPLEFQNDFQGASIKHCEFAPLLYSN